ncbi:MAG: polysaccharide deacetylase family protein [Clostridia bacterium]|nr:polysaccharide deacetylase family protein [Clostridia bacterium]
MKKIDTFYPGFVRKAISFTIDDGNVPMDKKFLEIVKPHGILGTFNLCSNNMKAFDPEGYVGFYKGYEIANHCKYHPFAMRDDTEYEFSDEPFSEATADATKLYKSDTDGLYHFKAANGWRRMATTEAYCRFADEGRDELEKVFGKGSVKAFVWPYSMQLNAIVFAHLRSSGYQSIRKTGETGDSAGFALPADRTLWSYNANHRSLLKWAKKYAECEDDGELKFFCFGVHAVDFERDNNWNELEEFAVTYGDRPNEYWYATVSDIFDYEDAVKALEINDDYIVNDSDVELYVKIDGKETVISPGSKISI